MILRFDDGSRCCCDEKFPLCQECEKRRRKRYRGDRDLPKTGRDLLDVAFAERILAKKAPSSSITWQNLSAGRSNS